MKTLIIYGSTYGYTKDCVEKLAQMLKGEVTAVDAEKDSIPDLAGFDTVIAGGSIYMGQVQKSLKQFCEEKESELTGKKLGLFLSCGFPENLEQNMSNSFPEALLESAACKVCFGGELHMDRMKFVHRTITNMMKKAGAKSGKEGAIPMPENISKLAEAMNA